MRGPTYPDDRKKLPSAPATFGLTGVDLLSFEDPAERFTWSDHPANPIRKLNEDADYAKVYVQTCNVAYFMHWLYGSCAVDAPPCYVQLYVMACVQRCLVISLH